MNDELIKTLNLDKVQAEHCKRKFENFVKEFWDVIIPDDMVWNWHMSLICEEVERVVRRLAERKPKEYDLAINVPPGSSKSTICTIMLPVWAWLIDPTIRTLGTSYSSGLSVDHSTKSRDIIHSDKFKRLFPEIQIRKDLDRTNRFKNTQGGERMAVSVTGTVTGFHGHLLIVDDPMNPKEATSETMLNKVNNFMDRTISTRKVNKEVTPTILIMQRLHSKDATGNWISKGKNIRHICLPAELSDDVSPKEVRGKYTDGLLDPKRMNRATLEEMKKELGSYGYAGQMMQRPSPDGGGVWKKWFKPISRADLSNIKLTRIGTDWDLAYTDKEGNSASAFVTAGYRDRKMYITDLGFERKEFPDLVRYMNTKEKPHYVENKASGVSAVQSLKSNGVPAIAVKPQKGDKVGRAKLVSPYAEAGMIYVAEDLLDKLYNDTRQGILMFPNAENDDLQDALTQSISRLLLKSKGKIANRSLM